MILLIPVRGDFGFLRDMPAGAQWAFVAVYCIAYACMLAAIGYAVWTLI
jgi:hypothetical protein